MHAAHSAMGLLDALCLVADDPAMTSMRSDSSAVYRLWDLGQQQLAALHYGPAKIALELAEVHAYSQRDARSLARLYLPLLEARRQIRYQAAEGVVVIAAPGSAAARAFRNVPTGTLLLQISATHAAKAAALRTARDVAHAARRSGRLLEMLLLLDRAGSSCMTSTAAPTFAAGLPVRWTTDAKATVAASTDPSFVALLPPPGRYTAGPLHALARESLLIGWEALALRWQHRHPPHGLSPWDEIAWLRQALQVDPACEPITMRLIALAEAIDRQTP